MGRAKTPSFVHELPLIVDKRQEEKLLVRFNMGRMLYNACLGESLRRLDLLRQSQGYQSARKIPYEDRKLRSAAFKEANREYGFTEYDMHSFAVKTRNACSIRDHLDVHTAQKLATRAFNAVQMYAFRKHGRPRFKGQNQMISVESKSNLAGIRFRINNMLSRVEWGRLVLPVMFDPKDKHGVQTHALSCETKYVRLVCRKIRDKYRFFAQLVQEGTPRRKSKNGTREGVIGMDLGPSTYALYAGDKAELDLFCSELEPAQKKIRLIQRKMDRSRRACNPDNYHSNGTIRTGPKKWVRSNRYEKAKQELSDVHRRKAAYRKTLHGELANTVLSLGNQVKLEKLSYKALQKMYGKSVGFRAPGMFVAMLRRKAESAGGSVSELPTGTLRLSQTCHCGHRQKKHLSDRWHECPLCGTTAQRDLYSAYLAYHVNENTLDSELATASWPGAESLLIQAMSRVQHKSTIAGSIVPQSFGLGRRKSGSPVKGSLVVSDVRDAVAHAEHSKRESPKKGAAPSSQNPRALALG
jgi:transposase